MEETKTHISSAADTDYSDEERYPRKKALITALLKWLECEFFGLFIFLSLFALTLVLKTKGDLLFGLCGMLVYIMVLVDFGLKEGSKARIKNDLRGDSVKVSFGLVLGAAAMLPALLSYLLLLLSYSGAAGSMVLPFKVMNLGLWGLIDLFVKDMDINHMNTALLWVYPLSLLIYPLSTFFGFRTSFNNEDIRTKIMYKR